MSISILQIATCVQWEMTLVCGSSCSLSKVLKFVVICPLSWEVTIDTISGESWDLDINAPWNTSSWHLAIHSVKMVFYNMYCITFLLYMHTYYTSSRRQLQMTLENMCSELLWYVMSKGYVSRLKYKARGHARQRAKALLLTTFTSVIKAHCTYTPCYTVICSISQKNIHSACVTILTCQKECSVFIL